MKNAKFHEAENHLKSKNTPLVKTYIIFHILNHYRIKFQPLSMPGTALFGTLKIAYFGHFSSKNAKIQSLLGATKTSKINFHIKKT